MRDGIRYKHHLAKDSVPHKSEDYIARLINDVMNHKELEDRMVQKELSWSKDEYRNNLTKKCRKLLCVLTQDIRGGRNPFIFAAAVIYLTDKVLARQYNHKPVLTQKIVSEATKIAEYSIRDHFVNVLKPIFFKRN